MALTKIGSSTSTASSTSRPVTLTGGAAVGQHVLIFAIWNAASSVVNPTVTDAKGNTWTVNTRHSNPDATNASLAFVTISAKITAALVATDVLTVQWTGSASYHGVTIYVADNLAASSWFDTSLNDDSNTVAQTSYALDPGVTPMKTNTQAFALVAFEGTGNPTADTPSGWTLVETLGVVGAKTKAVAIFSRTLTAGGTPNSLVGTLPVSSQWAGTMATFATTTSVDAPYPKYLIGHSLTSTSLTVAVKTVATTTARLAVSASSDMSSPTYGASATPDAAGWSQLTVTGLTANTRYYYAIEVNGTLFTAVTRRLKTKKASGSATSFSFGWSSCMYSSTTETTIFQAIAEACELSEFFHFGGDWHYGNSASTDPAVHRALFEAQLDNSAFAALTANVPLSYCPSDHDSGPSNWSPGPGVQTPAWLTVFRQMFPQQSLAPADGTYYSRVIGRVRFIFLDCRSYRSADAATDNSSKTMLGATQKAWLKAQLLEAEPLKVVFGDGTWIGSPVPGEDNWRGFNTERTELGAYVVANSVRMVYCHGDAHMVAADDGSGNNYGGFPVLSAAPINQTTSYQGGPYSNRSLPLSTAPDYLAHAYGKAEITDTGSTIGLSFAGVETVTGKVVTLSKTWDITSRPLRRRAGAWV